MAVTVLIEAPEGKTDRFTFGSAVALTPDLVRMCGLKPGLEKLARRLIRGRGAIGVKFVEIDFGLVLDVWKSPRSRGTHGKEKTKKKTGKDNKARSHCSV